MAECYLGHALFRGAADADMLQKIAETLGAGTSSGPSGAEGGALPDDMARAWGVAAMDGGELYIICLSLCLPLSLCVSVSLSKQLELELKK
jgi:hypothetical protein